MEHFAHSASKKLAAAGREIRYIEYRLKKKAQQQKHAGGAAGAGAPGSQKSSSSRSKLSDPGN